MAELGMIVDYKYCTGCHSCEIACRNEKGLSLDEWGIQVTEYGPVMIDGAWLWNFQPVLSHACDLCEERVAKGEKASCELHCLAQCIEIVELSRVQERVAQLGKAVSVIVP